MTIRGFDPELEQRIRELAKREHISLNQAVMLLLRRGAGLLPDKAPDRVGESLDRFYGSWTKAEADAFDAATQIFERIDESFWK